MHDKVTIGAVVHGFTPSEVYLIFPSLSRELHSLTEIAPGYYVASFQANKVFSKKDFYPYRIGVKKGAELYKLNGTIQIGTDQELLEAGERLGMTEQERAARMFGALFNFVSNVQAGKPIEAFASIVSMYELTQAEKELEAR